VRQAPPKRDPPIRPAPPATPLTPHPDRRRRDLPPGLSGPASRGRRRDHRRPRRSGSAGPRQGGLRDGRPAPNRARGL